MRPILQTISWIALAATILPSVVFLANKLELDQAKWITLAATLVWFAVTPLWMDRASQAHNEHPTTSRKP